MPFPIEDFVLNHHIANATDATNQVAIIAPYDLDVVSATARFRVNCASGTVDLVVAADAVAVSAGVTMVSTKILLSGTADTKVSPVFLTTIGAKRIPKGSALGLLFAGTLTNLVDLDITIVLRQVKKF